MYVNINKNILTVGNSLYTYICFMFYNIYIYKYIYIYYILNKYIYIYRYELECGKIIIYTDFLVQRDFGWRKVSICVFEDKDQSILWDPYGQSFRNPIVG